MARNSLNELEGALRGVIGLPIEILIEVLGYLALPDTLALSRSSKFFRRILMNPSAATLNVWRASIENVPGLPSCPKDLSEPQYAALIYSHHCTYLGADGSVPKYPAMPRLLKGGGCCTKTCLRRDKEAMEAWYKELHQRQLSRKEIRSEIGQIGDNLVERVLVGLIRILNQPEIDLDNSTLERCLFFYVTLVGYRLWKYSDPSGRTSRRSVWASCPMSECSTRMRCIVTLP
ncbi:F-box-like domain-containing protein [Rhizoctonia solani AG-1 IA]|uniref:F-box-like domain-containing protein n=1 Tax=Thanatephorus cucumeris (strain AG1-IA) TaxID=983506 RepID=L8X1I7_THACA|nr:F-box-like domain-containing protein [Rhizoctonia solani AG-1 IA]